MTTHSSGTAAGHQFIVQRSDQDDRYSIWAFDPAASELLTSVSVNEDARFPRSHDLVPIGGYLIDWGPLALPKYAPCFPFRLFTFDPTSGDPLNASAVQSGTWDKDKFWGYYTHYTWDADRTDFLQLVPMTGYVMAYMPTPGRGTFELFTFDPDPTDPGSNDPLPAAVSTQDAFPTIKGGHELHPIGNYVLDRFAETGAYRLWSFDPQLETPLSMPTIQDGIWDDIGPGHRLVVVGETVLDWVPEDGTYRLWGFDPTASNPLVGPLREGTLPEGFDATTRLTAIETAVPVDTARQDTPGTIEFMRTKIKHVVHYMLESRSFDSVVGWLYKDGTEGVNWVGAEAPFQGTSFDYTNQVGDRVFPVSLFNGGQLGSDVVLNVPSIDPFHGTPDSIDQLFKAGYRAYKARQAPDMGGFVKNNSSDEVMLSLTPEQLPVLNGLAQSFAISDRWFSSLPGGTDSNRATALTGSAYNITTTYEGGNAYTYFPYTPHRQGIWKVLQNNGVTDWKIYYSVLWYDCVFTYQLYLNGQVPSIDADTSDYLNTLDQFYSDAAAGTLPAFSFLEPTWIAPSGATSYHPGGDLVPGEQTLNKIYQAIANGPGWDETALLITFSKGGGLYDHVSPPYAPKGWPNDGLDGFDFDLLGPRVPAIVVSPWVDEKTVFRSGVEVPYSATSALATILKWFGVPRSRWGLGDRVAQAPSFESVFTRSEARTDIPSFTDPYDSDYPSDS